jgi:hypothetical protein
VVTFVLTDMVDSTALWDAHPQGMAETLARHDRLVGEVMASRGGVVLKTKGEGDATMSAFVRASDAVAAAIELQEQLGAEDWSEGLEVRVRVAVHTGEAHERDGDYFGPALNRAARLRSLAVGGRAVVGLAVGRPTLDQPEASTQRQHQRLGVVSSRHQVEAPTTRQKDSLAEGQRVGGRARPFRRGLTIGYVALAGVSSHYSGTPERQSVTPERERTPPVTCRPLKAAGHLRGLPPCLRIGADLHQVGLPNLPSV